MSEEKTNKTEPDNKRVEIDQTFYLDAFGGDTERMHQSANDYYERCKEEYKGKGVVTIRPKGLKQIEVTVRMIENTKGNIRDDIELDR